METTPSRLSLTVITGFPALAMSSTSSMNKYWIPHLDIHKKVITQELQYYLGPEATVRSFTRDVRNTRSLMQASR